MNKGHKLAEGEPKKIVDLYKKLLVNQLTDDDLEDYDAKSSGSVESESKKEHNENIQKDLDVISSEAAITPESVEKEGKKWKNYMVKTRML